jgi:hypothetical protein
MDVISLLKSALLALTAYLELRNKAFYYDILTKSRSQQDAIIDEIEKLRSKPTNASADLADILRRRLGEERKFAEHLSATYSKSQGWDSNPNS